MKKLKIAFLFALLSFYSAAQVCNTNPIYNNSPAGLYPDTLAKACKNNINGYTTQLDIINATDTCVTFQGFPICLYLKATRIASVTGLPAGFTLGYGYNGNIGGYDAWINNGNEPNFIPYHGCMRIDANQATLQATASGTYPITINVDFYVKNQTQSPPIFTNYTWLSTVSGPQPLTYQLVVQNCLGVCTYTLQPTSYTAAWNETSTTFSIDTQTGCQWTAATSNCNWITSVTPANGSTDATVTVNFQQNTTPNSRTCSVIAGAETFTLTQQGQPACIYSLGSSTITVSAAQTSYSLPITTNPGCAWAATENCPWLTISNPNGTGSSNINLAFPTNTSTTPNTCTITVSGQTFTITQLGTGCTYVFNQASDTVAASATSYQLPIVTNASCNWAATENCPWLTISNPNGTGSSNINLGFPANTSTTPNTCTITVQGQTFTLVQQGQPACTYSLGSSTTTVSASQTSYSLPITTNPGCTWVATENCPWLSITNPSGTGSGTISIAFSANTTTTPNTCTITVEGQTFTITQSGVTSGNAPVASFTYSPLNTSGPCPIALDYVNTSTNTPTSYQWTFAGANPSSSNSANPTNILYDAPGDYVVQLTVSNTAGSNTKTDTITIDCATGIAETIAQNIKLFPNPTNGILNLSFELMKEENVSLQVYNMLGQNVYTQNAGRQNGQITKQIVLPNATTGIYLLQLSVGAKVIAKRFVVE